MVDVWPNSVSCAEGTTLLLRLSGGAASEEPEPAEPPSAAEAVARFSEVATGNNSFLSPTAKLRGLQPK